MFTIDVAQGLVALYRQIREDHELFAWARLLFSAAFSGSIAFLVTAGVQHSLWQGMTAAGVAVLSVTLIQPKGRELTLTLPRDAVTQYQQTVATGQTVIQSQEAQK